MSDQAVILQKWFFNGGIILAKGKHDHLYNFLTMPKSAQSQILGLTLYIAFIKIYSLDIERIAFLQWNDLIVFVFAILRN